MELIRYDNGTSIETDERELFSERGVYAIVGAGGKTSLCFRAGWELQAKGRHVAITTTTHMYRTPEFIGDGNPGLVFDRLNENGLVFTGGEYTDLRFAGVEEEAYKIGAIDPGMLRLLADSADFVLIEADGAAKRPLKVPADWEPAIPENTDRIIAVAGLSAIGQEIGACCKRADLVCKILGREETQTIRQEDIAALLYEGYIRPELEGTARSVDVLLNQCNEERRADAQLIAEKLFEASDGRVRVFFADLVRPE